MKKLSLPYKILIFMILGAITGFVVGPSIKIIQPVGTVFLRLLKMNIALLVFFSVTGSISSISDMRRLKKVGSIFFWYWLVTSSIAAASGILWSEIIKPGVGINLSKVGGEVPKVANVDLLSSIINWIPDNVVKAFAEGNLVQIIVFGLFAGLATIPLQGTKAGQFLNDVFTSGLELMTTLVRMVMQIAPYGVFALMANVTGTVGGIALKGIGKMLLTQYLAYATVIFIVYPIILKFFVAVSPVQYYKNIFPAMVFAFSTQSSSATIPVTMECTKNRAGVPEDIVNLITAPAATVNMHAACAEYAIYAIFASQLYNVPLSLTNLLTILVLGVILAAGAAGVPGGGIIMCAIMLQIMNLPTDIVSWVAGVYILIDMPNTMLNVTGDTVGMVYTAKKIGELDLETFNKPKPVTIN